MTEPPVIFWFRHDLRLDDNPALRAAHARGAPVIPVSLWSPEDEGDWPPGAASRWWLRQSLERLDRSLRAKRSRLILRRGPARRALADLAAETGARAVFWNRRVEPAARTVADRVAADLAKRGIEAVSHNGSLLADPDDLRTGDGKPYRVFTAFWNALQRRAPIPAPEPEPKALRPPGRWPRSASLKDLGIGPLPPETERLGEVWRPGAGEAASALDRFVAGALAGYDKDRDRPDREGVSRLSPYLHFGETGPRRVWSAVRAAMDGARDGAARKSAGSFLRQIAWREFAAHLLIHFPHTVDRPLRPEFEQFPWRDAPDEFDRWREGMTGCPIVDAGMRQLRQTGWMHNRARMIAASFLVKDLLIPWQYGARWFWDTLVDADLANNTLGWQWVAGCGADAAPYFRVFNPAIQQKKFDPEGRYVRRWVAELANPADNAGGAYPPPVIDHSVARVRALAALAAMRKRQSR